MTHQATARVSSVAAIVLAMLLTGCAALPGIIEQYQHPPAEIAEDYDCLVPYPGPGLVPPEDADSREQTPSGRSASAGSGSPDVPEPGSVPEGFTPVEVIRCSAAGTPPVEDEAGRWATVGEEHLSGDFEPLLQALDIPSDRAGNMACPAKMEILPQLWLVDAAGQVIRPARPTTACGFSKPGVAEALAGLPVKKKVTHKTRLIEPREALDAGCSNNWKAPLPAGTGLALAPESPVPAETGPALPLPETSIDDGAGRSVPGSPGLLPEPGDVDSMRVCLYGLDEPPEPEPIRGGNGGLLTGQAIFVSATFESAHTLGEEQSRLLLKAVRSERHTDQCETVAQSFAVLWPLEAGQKSGAPITIELDGCQRLIPADGQARKVPAALLEAVAGR